MSNSKRPDFSAIPRISEPIDGDELTAHFTVPRELLEQLRDDDEATRVGPMPAGLLEDENLAQVHTAPTLPPPPPSPATELPARAALPAVPLAFPPASDAELHAQISAMRRPQRVALGSFVGFLVTVAAILLGWRILSP